MRLGILLAGWVALGGCQIEEGRPPIARIDLVPAAIPEHDGFETVVTLDGTMSADPVDDPEGSEPLEYHWEILGDDFELEPGADEDESAPTVRFRGDRPAAITLTVTDSDGLDASATTYLQLTVL
jgi:hypothetical protein